ncbi:mucin-2-like [Leguminivora glycinivorella]|uniref:mucin-2-like n=1 Tax=Leguminivora glycinivorella TaxID=1035111 RepID=UPI00201099B3|nr:mucin-2-like [Leguminivora glycinivorella]
MTKIVPETVRSSAAKDIVDMMLQRKVLALLLVTKMAVSQSIYPTTAVSYSTSSVPTIQTLPVSPTAVNPIPATVSPVPATVTAIPATGSPAKVTTLPMSAQPATVTAMPVGSSAAPATSGVKVTTMHSSSMSSPVSSSILTEPKAHFLPTPIPDPKVTILPHDTPIPPIAATAPPASSSNMGHLKNIKEKGPASPVKRISMACTEDFSLPNEDLCPGFPLKDLKPPTAKSNKGNLSNPIDFEGLIDGFFSCL